MAAPYHYGCHYSNSGTVLHFLVRMPPFTKMFLQYQGTRYNEHWLKRFLRKNGFSHFKLYSSTWQPGPFMRFFVTCQTIQ